jgi:glycogen synthase
MPFAMAPTQTSRVPPVLFFDDASLEGVVAWVDRATNWFHTSDWQRLQCQAMRRNFAWELPAQRYLALYSV